MKLLIAIVQDEDANRLVSKLMGEGYGVTKLATTGGFLRSGNTTLLSGVEDDQVDKVIDLIRQVCSPRKQVSAAPSPLGGMNGSYSHYPLEVTVGGATVFVLSVDQFVKV